MRIGSLFAGVGGLELGLEWAGVGHTVWQVERDEFCRSVLARHWPDAQRYDDVHTVGAHNLGSVDVICGGYPCQPFSTAGLRNGTDDPRHLWPEFARILGELRPRYAVLENVADHLGLGFDAVLADLAALGYDAEWDTVSACIVGSPQPRERLFVVAFSGRNGRPEVVSGTPRIRDEAVAASWSAANADPLASHAERLAALERVSGQPSLLGSGHGFPEWVDQLQALGNAVVPQVAEVVGRRLLEIAGRVA